MPDVHFCFAVTLWIVPKEGDSCGPDYFINLSFRHSHEGDTGGIPDA